MLKVLISLALVHSVCAYGKPSNEFQAQSLMEALFDGPPALSKTVLDPAAYVEEGVQKLSQAQIAYINWSALEDIFRNLGLENPPRILTPELEKAILDKAGFAKPVNGDKAESFITEFRKVYSIRYGGHWINFNFGAGRNGAFGLVDIKGIGKTALVRPWSDGGHGSGVVGLAEAIKEAVWSNVLHEELPLGANRVLFILTTGTLTDPKDSKSEARALIVREDSLRPAYYQQNTSVNSHLMSEELQQMHTAADAKRMEMLLPRLLKAMPKPAGFKASWSPAEQMRASFFELIDRIARQYAKGYVNQILMAGTSTSNVEISGRAIDYGATTAVLGYPRIRYLKEEAANGDTDSLKSDLVLEFAQDLRKVLPADLLAGVPSDQELSQRVDSQYKMRVEQGFLELAGVPKEFSKELHGTQEGRELSLILITIARAGNETITDWDDSAVLKRQGTYDLAKVLEALTREDGGRSTALAVALYDPELRTRLQNAFTGAFARLSLIAQKENITPAALRRYMLLAVSARNRPMRKMIQQETSALERIKVGEAFTAGNTSAVQSFADGRFKESVREFKGKPYELVIRNPKPSGTSGAVSLLHFDLKTGKERVVSKPLSEVGCESLLH